MIDQERYKDALNSMALTKFKVFDELSLRLLPVLMENKDAPMRENVFPNSKMNVFGDLYQRAFLLEKGIDRNLMNQFEALTAKFGYNNSRDRQYIFKHGRNWGPPNWTRKNCLFCYDFLVDAIVKNQKTDSNFSEIELRIFYVIKSIEDFPIYNKDGKISFVLAKGEECEAFILGRVDQKWEIYGHNDLLIQVRNPKDNEKVIGYFREEDKNKIEFKETHQFVRNGEGNYELNEMAGG